MRRRQTTQDAEAKGFAKILHSFAWTTRHDISCQDLLLFSLHQQRMYYFLSQEGFLFKAFCCCLRDKRQDRHLKFEMFFLLLPSSSSLSWSCVMYVVLCVIHLKYPRNANSDDGDDEDDAGGVKSLMICVDNSFWLCVLLVSNTQEDITGDPFTLFFQYPSLQHKWVQNSTPAVSTNAWLIHNIP